MKYELIDIWDEIYRSQDDDYEIIDGEYSRIKKECCENREGEK